ncbi:DUF803-domain-containing protein [Macrolepiota fuliginosa MF-IS2]|uniref:DUF803-domain-containing protein n=1 Tax=Macrolepiota fuliginosa MF-IS2 TaxID=1400762 RepID=A0A9P6C8E2_9AGAR|nr:DUF803-domain-containing protein [Macrolepiota fuliginosa MF-IS2]
MTTAIASPWFSIFPTSIGMDDLPRLATQTVIGIAVAVSGNVIISLALNLQKLAHKRLDAQRPTPSDRDGHMKPLNQNRPARLNLDEDLETISEQSTPPSQHTLTPETRPLLPIHNHNYTPHEDQERTPNTEPQQSGFLMRMFCSKTDQKKKYIATEDATTSNSVPTHKRTDEEEDDQTNETAYLKSKIWWSGFFLMNVGELGNFISYAFAPASVVAPLGTFALIANCVFAPVMLGEHFRKIDFLGVCVAIVGAVTVVLSSNPSDTRLDPGQLIEAIKQTPFLIYVGCYTVGTIILATLSRGKLGRTYVFIDVGLCALFGGFTVLSTKALSTIITMKWYGVFAEWITYPLILTLVGTGIGQIRYLNRALMRFDSKAVIPTQFVFFTLSAITGSALLYGDFKKARFHEIVTFLYGCAATFGGVFILANGPTDHNEEKTAQPDEAAEEGTRLGVGTIGKRTRGVFVLSSGMEIPRETPTLRTKRSSVALGLSPAQHLLLVRTPTRESLAIPRGLEAGYEDVDREVLTTPGSLGRNRTLHGFGNEGPWSGSPRSRSSTLRDNTLPERLRSSQFSGSPKCDSR